MPGSEIRTISVQNKINGNSLTLYGVFFAHLQNLRGVSNCSQLVVSCIYYLYQIISACFSDCDGGAKRMALISIVDIS